MCLMKLRRPIGDSSKARGNENKLKKEKVSKNDEGGLRRMTLHACFH